ncbi:hypothetical protein EYD45_13205 [Hyunsoonleella flava]|uniref:DUF5723 domain-containing protein n=1 Tax=Hyunsoonleella flava TaxID=2527939 RepID=A0A4Q9FBH4_9FLAO|nr:DUF5723 family protein [Hyunsoonleella flava]TBN01358.1 hypothetical protein EYD45_13205 [Hyunsoonleella flava]
MRSQQLFILMVFLASFSFGQNKQVLYGFSEVPQSLLLNPGMQIDNKGYFGISLLSHVHVNGSSSGISLYDLFAEDGRDFNLKLRNTVNTLRPTDFLTATQQLEIISGGFALGPSYDKNEYLSFGLYQEFDAISYFPKDYAILALEGNQRNIGRPFLLEHLNFSANVVSVLHIGYNKRVNSKFTYGVRGKIYSNVADISSNANSGRFITLQGDNNIYKHFFDLNLEVKTSGIDGFLDDNTDSQEAIKDLRRRLLFGGSLGVGIDLGFTYHITDQWFVDASILDVGFITHSKDIKRYQVKGDLEFEGIDPIFPENNDNLTADEYWSQIEEDFEEIFTLDSTTSRYTTSRPVKFNSSLNYAFGKKKLKDCDCSAEDDGYLNRIGAQLYAIKRPKGLQAALTAYYYRRIFSGFSAKATYTVDTYSFSNIGLGVSANIFGLNLYLMADNLLAYRNIYDAQHVSLQLGLNYIFKNEN